MSVEYIKRLAGPYVGDGTGQKTFSFGFLIFDESDVYVAVAASSDSEPSDLQQGTDYTVSMNADQSATPGGTITLTSETGLAKDAVLVIGSAVDYTQTLDLTNYTRFAPERITTELDRIVVMIQQIVELLGRVVQVPPTSSISPSDLFFQLLHAAEWAAQSAEDAAAALAACEQIRQLIEQYSWDIPHVVDSLRDVEDYPYDGLFAVAGFGNAGGNGQNISNRYVKAEGSTELRTLGDRFADVVNVRDFGARGDGVHDDTSAFVSAAEKGQVYVPRGKYVLSQLVSGNFFGVSGSEFPQAKLSVLSIAGKPATFRRPYLTLNIHKSDFDSYVQSDVSCQSFALCDGLAFLSFSPSSNESETKHWVGVYDLVSGERQSFFCTGGLNTDFPWNEGLRVYKSGEERFLVCKNFESGDSTPGLAVYNITALPADGATVIPVSRHPNLNLLSTWFYDGGFYYVEQQTNSVGNVRDRILYAKYDETFNCVGFICFAPEDGVRSNSSFSDVFTKKQSAAFFNGRIVFGCGGWYGGAIEEDSYQGLKIFSANGTKIDSLMYDPSKSASILATALGVSVTQQENEGITVYDGWLYSLSVINSTNSSTSAPTFCIVEELSQCVDAIDFSKALVSDSGINTDRFSIGTFPIFNSSEKTLVNPQTGEKFVSISNILDYMLASGQKVFTFYTGRATVTDLNGEAFGSYQVVRLTALSSVDVMCELLCSSNSDDWYKNDSLFRYAKRDGIWVKENAGSTKVRALIVDDNTYSGNLSFGSVLFPNYNRTKLIYALRLATASDSDTVGVGGNSASNSPRNIRLGVRSADGESYGYVDARYNSFYPLPDNNCSLGTSANRWTEVFAATGTINTSDYRCKQNITNPTELLLKAWGNVGFKVFQFKDAVEKKGESSARYHVGVIAQDVQTAFTEQGLDASKYGLFCHDAWQDEYETVEVVDQPEALGEDGEVVTPAVIHTERRKVLNAGDRYGLRYEEALCLEAAYQRYRADKLEERLVALEKRMTIVEAQ